jgi:hypothetical protein
MRGCAPEDLWDGLASRLYLAAFSPSDPVPRSCPASLRPGKYHRTQRECQFSEVSGPGSEAGPHPGGRYPLPLPRLEATFGRPSTARRGQEEKRQTRLLTLPGGWSRKRKQSNLQICGPVLFIFAGGSAVTEMPRKRKVMPSRSGPPLPLASAVAACQRPLEPEDGCGESRPRWYWRARPWTRPLDRPSTPRRVAIPSLPP